MNQYKKAAHRLFCYFENAIPGVEDESELDHVAEILAEELPDVATKLTAEELATIAIEPPKEWRDDKGWKLPQQASEWVRRWGDHSEQICSKKGCKYYGTTFGTKNGKPVVACSEHQTELDICNHCGNQIPYGRCPKCDPEDQQELLNVKEPQQPTNQQRSDGIIECPKCGSHWTGNVRDTGRVFCQKCGNEWTPDQQRSEAVTVTDKHYAFWDWIKPYLYNSAGKIKMSADEFEQKIATMFPDQSAAIAERDEQLATERELHKMTFEAHQDSIAERDATIASQQQGIANLIRDSNAEIAELRAEVGEWQKRADGLRRAKENQVAARNDKIAALQARVVELEAALMPFACVNVGNESDDDENIWRNSPITYGQIRVASKVIDASQPTTEKP